MSYDLNELERLEKAATPGLWRFDSDGENGFGNANSEGWEPDWIHVFSSSEYGAISPQDRELIEYLRNAAPELIATIRRQETEITELHGMLADVLRSAYPHPVEHPTMFKMWNRIRERLEPK